MRIMTSDTQDPQFYENYVEKEHIAQVCCIPIKCEFY